MPNTGTRVGSEAGYFFRLFYADKAWRDNPQVLKECEAMVAFGTPVMVHLYHTKFLCLQL